VGYVVLDGHPDPLRVRAAWVTDDEIAAMAERYPARRGDVIDAQVLDDTTSDSPESVGVVEVEGRDESGRTAA
jgi:hypothetical protein